MVLRSNQDIFYIDYERLFINRRGLFFTQLKYFNNLKEALDHVTKQFV